jgi:hypothetical protein
MKNTITTMAFLYVLSAATAVFAQEAETIDAASEPEVTTTGTSEPVEQISQHQPTDQAWTMHHGMDRQQQHAGMRHGGQHGGGKHAKGRHEKHEQVVKRLDLIEARLAKIEAMLEIMMRR